MKTALSSALAIAFVMSSTTAFADGDAKKGGATAAVLAQESKPKAKPTPRSAAKTKAKPKPAAQPKPSSHAPRALGKPEPRPEGDKPVTDRPTNGKVDGNKWRPKRRA